MLMYLIMILFMLLSMGFYLLIERKLMGLIQYRLGPSKVLFLGLFQFLIDMIKLISKEFNFIFKFKFNYFFFVNLLLLMNLLIWLVLMFNYMIYLLKFSFMMILFITMFKLILMLLFLFNKKSIYVLISYIRMLIQYISFDILIVIIILILIILIKNFNLMVLFNFQKYLNLYFMSFYIFNIWILCILMEVLRLPFDFYESESELISGFNLELSSFMFMMIFMIEYLDMIFFINLTVIIFFYINLFYFIDLMMLLLILWIRLFFIRYRYDLILNLMWKVLIFFLLLKFILIINLIYF